MHWRRQAPAMGHSEARAPLDFQLFNFFWTLQSRANSLTLTLDCTWLPTQKEYWYSFVIVYCVNFTMGLFLCYS